FLFAIDDAKTTATLWTSNGLKAGTKSLQSFNVGTSDLYLDVPAISAASIGNNLVFATIGGALWKTDGTLPGTVIVALHLDTPRTMTAAGSHAFFVTTTTNENGYEITHEWVTNGTITGTQKLHDDDLSKYSY